ncbi:hypothetical protein SFIMM107S_07389 [Streptomyces griseus]
MAFSAGPRRGDGGMRVGAGREGAKAGDYSMTSSTSMLPRVALEYGQ